MRTQERRAHREREAARGEGTPSGEEILEREAVRARVVAAVLALEEPYRTSVLLRFFENLPPRAIAARLGVPVETVRTRLDREHGGGREAWSVALLSWARPGPSVAGGAGLAATAKVLLGAGGLALATLFALRWLGSSPVPAQTPQVAFEPRAAALEPALAVEPGAREPIASSARGKLALEPAVAPFTAAGGALRLTVHWSDGTPAAGIQARIESPYTESPFFHAHHGTTDGAGGLLFTELPAGSSILTLDRDQARRVEIEPGAETPLEITLARGFDVDGLVVDRTGLPVAGAELWLSDLNDFTGAFVGTTGTDGRFELRSVNNGQQLGAFAAGHSPALLASLQGEDGARVSTRLVLLGPGGEVDGSVRGPEGQPIADAQVLVGSEQLEFRRVFVPGEGELVGTVAPARLVRTDAAGRFRVSGVPPGRVPLFVRADGCAPWRSEVTLDADTPLRIEITLEAEASLVGQVLDEQGAPCEHAWLQLASRFGLLDPTVTTTVDGRYRLGGLAPGRNVVQVRAEKLGSAEASFELAAGEERSWDPVVGLGLVLAGRVLDEGGTPLRDWDITVVGDLPGETPSWGSARTDAEGRFRVKSLEDMPYRLTLEPPGSSLAVLELGGFHPGGEERVIRVPANRLPSAYVRGSVRDASGAPPANLALELATSSMGIPSGADAQGSFELGPLVPGLYTLRVRAQGHVEHVLGPHRLAPDETWDLGTVVLEPAGSLVVHVTRAPGPETLEPWFRVLRASDDGSFDLGRLESNEAGGAWRREALAAGRYVLEVSGNGLAATRVPFELRPGEEHRLEVPLQPGLRREIQLRTNPDLGITRVSLRVLGADGVTLVEQELWARVPGDYRTTLTLAPGLHRLVAELPDGPRVEAELRVAPDESLPLVLQLR